MALCSHEQVADPCAGNGIALALANAALTAGVATSGQRKVHVRRVMRNGYE